MAKHCLTCVIPTKKSVEKSECHGFKDGRIYAAKNCPKWKQCPEQLSVSEAMAYASSAGIHVTRPTMINWCVVHGIGKQIPKMSYGKWYINPDKLHKLLREEEI